MFPRTIRAIFWIVLFSLCLSLGSWASFTLAATTVTDVYDLPSSTKISTASNHKIVITVSEAVDEGETLTVTYPTSFTTSSITEDDVDVSDDGVDLTTASDCTGSEEASVAMSSGTLTVTICSGDGGQVLSGSEVIVEIGTNASASGSGSNQITNPSASATYYLSIGGTSGMTGSIPIPIVSDDDGNVSATIPAAEEESSGGGGGGGSAGGIDSGGDTGDGDAEERGGIVDEEDGGTDETTDGSETTDDETAGGVDEGEDTVAGGDTGEEGDATTDGGDTDGGDAAGGDTDAASGADADGTTAEDGSGDSGSAEETEGEASDEGGEDASSERSIRPIVTTPDGSITITDTVDASVLPGTSVRVDVEVSGDPERVTFILGKTEYRFVEREADVYGGVIRTPDSSSYASIVVEYSDGDVQTAYGTWSAQAPGLIYEVIDGSRVAVSDSLITLYDGSGLDIAPWNASAYGQENPIVTTSGYYSWYVPNGTYTVTIGKDGYETVSRVVRVSNAVLAQDLQLNRLKEDVVLEETEEDGGIVDRITNTVAQAENGFRSVVEDVNVIRTSPQAQAAAEMTTPVVVATAAAGTGVLATSFQLLTYLRYIFTAPFLFFARRKKQAFGVVYNALSKVPVDLAVVRLKNAQGKIVKTRVTDPEGRFFFKADPGMYTLDVRKPGFSFPSQYIEGSQDGAFQDVYTDQQIEVTEQNALLTPSIPIDPMESTESSTSKRLQFNRLLRLFQYGISFVGFVLAVVVVVIQPTMVNIGILCVHILLYIGTFALVKRLGSKKGWGIVRSAKRHSAISNAVVRLFEPTYNKLIESTLTDAQGRYTFMAGPNTYYLTVEKEGFEKAEVRPIDYSDKDEPELISVDVELDPSN